MTARPTTDARDRALARGDDGGLGVTYLVEAGAGTGKTTVLVDRLVALVESGVQLDRIVAITFTEKAAGELRLRLRAGLEEARAESTDEARAALMRDALAHLDRSHVTTIHGFCNSLLRERPVEAGIDPGFGVADQLRQRVVEDTVWEEWIRNELAEELPRPLADAHALGFRLRRIRDLASRLLAHRDALDGVPPAYEETGGDELLTDLSRTAESFVTSAEANCRSSEDAFVPRLVEFRDAVRALDALPPDARLAHALRHLTTPPLRKGRKGDWDGDSLAEIRDEIKRLRSHIEDVEKLVRHNAAVRVVAWLRGFVDAYQREKDARGILDFQDMLTLTRDLLRDRHDVRGHFKRAFDRILLDEFQDTDPLQCEIAFFLAEREGGRATRWHEVELTPGKLFVVGDPKQSIYRFRRADIETYEKAKDLIRETGEVLELVENFRTRPAIIDGVNTVFGPLMRAPEEGPRFQPEYAPLTAYRERDDRGPGSVVLDLTDALPEKHGVGDVRAVEARIVAGFLKRIQETDEHLVYDKTERRWRRPGLRDVAILFQTMISVGAYEDALTRHEINYRIAGGKRFYARSEVLELISVLSAVEDPHNGAAVVGALRSPFFGVPDDDIVLHRHRTGALSYLDGEDGVASVREAFDILRELHADRESDRIASLLERLFDRTKAPELFLLKPSGEQRHANLMKVAEIADALERSEHLSFGGFVRWLRETLQLTPEEAESPLSEEGDDFVRLMTIHKAKGLEFPITVLADLSSYSSRKDEIVVNHLEGRMDLGFGSKEKPFGTDTYADAHAVEKERREAEVTRLLYVAMTRARDLVVLPWLGAADGGDPPGLLARLREIRSLEGSPDVTALEANDLDPGAATQSPGRLRAADILAAVDAASDARAARERWTGQMDDTLVGGNRPLAVATPSAGDYDPTLSGPTRVDAARPDLAFGGTAFGSLVHDTFEALSFETTTAELALRVATTLALPQGLNDEAAEAAAGLVTAGLASDVMRSATQARRSWKEVPVVTEVDGGLLEGTIDLLFEDDDGLVIVDYKTNIPGEGGVPALADHYAPQMRSYAAAMRQATGREVSRAVLLFLRGGDDGSVIEADIPL